MRTRQAHTWDALEDWLDREPGSLIAAAENAVLREVLSDLFGYHLVQVGDHHASELTAASRISHKAVLRITDPAPADSGCVAVADCEALPLAGGSTDVIVLPHVLEVHGPLYFQELAPKIQEHYADVLQSLNAPDVAEEEEDECDVL